MKRNFRSHSFIRNEAGDALIFILILMSVIGILFNLMANLIVVGKQTIQKTNFQIDAMTLGDLAAFLTASPASCMNFHPVPTKLTTPGPASLPTTVAGSQINQLLGPSGQPLIYINQIYNRLKVVNIQLYDMGNGTGSGSSPPAQTILNSVPNSIHFVGLDLTLQNTNKAFTNQTIDKISYFYAELDSSNNFVACILGGSDGMINAVSMHPSAGPGAWLEWYTGSGYYLDNLGNQNSAGPSGQEAWIYGVGATSSLCAPDFTSFASDPPPDYVFLAPVGGGTVTPNTSPPLNCVTPSSAAANWIFEGYNSGNWQL